MDQRHKNFGKKNVINLYDIGLGKNFLFVTPRAWATKWKLYKINFFKIKNFHESKDTIKKAKTLHKMKIFVNHLSIKDLVFKI